MGDLIIQRKNFEDAKNELEEFSKKIVTPVGFDTVNTSKGVGEWLGDFVTGGGIGIEHKVTGKELNNLTGEIQKQLIAINNTHHEFVREFGQVYKALEALDKDYIYAILTAIKATEETSKGVESAQYKISKVVEGQKKTLEMLKDFKAKLDGYTHLGDIDRMWNDCQEWHDDMEKLSDSIHSATQVGETNTDKIEEIITLLARADLRVDDLENLAERQGKELDDLISFASELEKIVHLKDADEMWESLSKANKSLLDISAELNSLKSNVAEHRADINKLAMFVEKISAYEHMDDIDRIWRDNEETKEELVRLRGKDEEILAAVKTNQTIISVLKAYKEHLSEMEHLDDVDALWEANNTHKGRLDAINNDIADVKSRSCLDFENLSKKIKYAYWIAGGSAALAVVELILLVLNML